MKSMQVIVPMGGQGERFKKAGFKEPKPLLSIHGRPLIEHLLDQFPKEWDFVFPANEEHLATTDLRQVLEQARPGCRIVPIPSHKKGPVHSVLLAADAIAEDQPTVVNYCDFSFRWNPMDFTNFVREKPTDGAIVAYKGFHPHYLRPTLYAYLREDKGLVAEVKEKGHFTPDRTQERASSGTYYFSSGRLMKKYFRQTVEEDLNHGSEYYVSLVYNLMIRDHRPVRAYEIPVFLQWGTPEDLQDYLYWDRLFIANSNRQKPKPSSAFRLVMPMAGEGSRFGPKSPPKPLITVLGKPMFQAAIEHLPASSGSPVLLCRTSAASAVQKASPQATIVTLDQPTQGQADTTELALARLDPKEPVLVSACDHGLLWNAEAFEKLLTEKPDAIVFGNRGYPGAERTPKAFSYIDADAQGRIRSVGVKKPFPGPARDQLILVGTFYFATASLMGDLIRELKQRDIRVNGERYLDSVINVLIEKKKDVRLFDTQGYLNWGTPEALAEFSYWHRFFTGSPS